ncbi:MAG: hypothetical protein VW230_02365 [Candidatus Poseidoniales archaeon]
MLNQMDMFSTVVLLLHPIFAIVLITAMWWQYSWKTRQLQFKGEERTTYVAQHQKIGERLLVSAIMIVLLAFVARAIDAYIHNESMLKSLIPSSLHGFSGPIGLFLLYYMVRFGRRAADLKEKGESFALQKKQHGRASDLVMILVFIHSFLGFLYIFEVL